MQDDRIDRDRLKADFVLPWLVAGVLLMTLLASVTACQMIGAQLQQPLPEEQRVLIRTVLYGMAIVTFPMTNLLRHIQLRLNQTMPLARLDTSPADAAKSRYLMTVIASMSLLESVGLFGFVMFILGDSYSTLYIFTGMSVLGLLLYRPKLDEYRQVIDALARQKHE